MDEPKRRAGELADRLDAKGKPEAAAKVRSALGEAEDKVLFALREACLTVLTAVETIDAGTETLAEELRTSVESHLRRHDG